MADRPHLHPAGTEVIIDIVAGCAIDPDTNPHYILAAQPGTRGRYLRPSPVVGLDNWHIIEVAVTDTEPIPGELPPCWEPLAGATVLAPLRPDQFHAVRQEATDGNA